MQEAWSNTGRSCGFEDSEAGIDAAYNGNIPVICVPDMLQPSQAHKDKARSGFRGLITGN